MKLTFLGAAHEVTGSCTLLTVGQKKILIDCGMEQGADIYQNADLPVAPGDLDALLLTHAHIDHSGKIPLLVSGGFVGKIYTTEATTRLCRLMLLDSAHIQESEAEWRTRKAKRSGKPPVAPMYTTEDATNALTHFAPCRYGEPVAVTDGVRARFLDAGHLLGSASVELTVTENGKETVLLFSGDVGNVSRPLIRDPQPPERADFVVVESTYGDRLHGDRPDYVTQLTGILQETFDRGGNVVIPSFAVGRTQELLYCIHQIKRERRIVGHNRFPVYVDSPLAVEATGIYSDETLSAYYDEETLDWLQKGENPLQFPGLRLAITSEESQRINNDTEPKVILSASGMCEAGRIRHHLKHNLWRPENTILFVGYQSEGTLGRHLLNGATSVKLFGEEIEVRAHIEQMQGISGHADRDMLLSWLSHLSEKPKKVFVGHGQDAVCDIFADAVRERLGMDAEAPYSGSEYDLSAGGVCVREGNKTPLRKAEKTAEAPASAMEQLRAAGRRLNAVIEQNRGGANRDLLQMAQQISALCDRFER